MRENVVIPIRQCSLSEYHERVDALLAMSQSILEAAQQGDWGLALNRQRLRSAELEGFFAIGETNIAQDVAELIASGIRRMLGSDAKVTSLAYLGRESLSREVGVAHKQGQAAQAYQRQL
ncbi:MAG: hypothetical protein ACI89D_001825 [Bermanella sp.]|jgi:hypothetical protein